MTTAAELVARYSAGDGFKNDFGFLGGKRGRQAKEIFASADSRGAAQSYLLDQREHDGTHYHLRAIALEDGLPESLLAELTREVQLVALGTVRYEGMMAPTLPDAVGSDHEASTIHGISRPAEGVLVYPVTELSKRTASSWALWAVKDGRVYIYPIADKKL